MTHWKVVLQDALHSNKSLLCTSIDCTPRRRMFTHACRTVNGTTITFWLKPGPTYVKRHVRNEHEPLVDEEELTKLNSNYAHVRMQDRRKTFVFIRDLSLHQSGNENQIEVDNSDETVILEPAFEDNVNTTVVASPSDSNLKQLDESSNIS